MSPNLLAYLMLERSMEALQDDVFQEKRYDAILSAMDSLWWTDLSNDEHDALSDDVRSVVQAHVVHEGV